MAALAGRIRRQSAAGDTDRPATARDYRCNRCGSALFGDLNENCQHCGPSAGQDLADAAPILMVMHGLAPEPPPFPSWGGASAAVPVPFESGGGGDFGGAGASSSWDSGSTTGSGD